MRRIIDRFASVAIAIFTPVMMAGSEHPLAASMKSVSEVSKDVSMIRANLTARYAQGQYGRARAYLGSERRDGSWADIDYNSTDGLRWPPIKHLDRLEQMSIAFANKDSPNFHSTSMLDGISSGLEYWSNKKAVSTNWWHNQIGQQLDLEKIAILAGDSLPAEQVVTAATYLHGPGDPGTMQKPEGQNLVWFAEQLMVRGVLTNFSQDISNAASIIENSVSIKGEDGSIQPDFSFHQHGNLLYNGGYGQGFLTDSLQFAAALQGTQFAFTQDKLDILSDFLLQGSRLMMRGHMLDYGAIGREISRKEGGREADRFVTACEELARMEPDKAQEYAALEAHIEGTGAPHSFLGHKHFWNSDFSVHQRELYYTSVKMNSHRNNGMESINGENVKGYWLPYGATYIARRGDEYAGIFPVWDWFHVPGVTSVEVQMSLEADDRQPGSFVGGVSDGEYGASAMDLELPSIHAHKAWFYFDKEFVALGSGISSPLPQVVSTTLNQTLLKGDVIADGQVLQHRYQVLKSVRWLLHDGVGYVLPPQANLYLNIGPQQGSWNDINLGYSKDRVEEMVLQMWFDHGHRPEAASYQYIVVPGIDAAGISEYTKNPPVRTLANSKDVQAVRHERLGISQVVFYAPGHLILTNDLAITVDKPCIVQIRELAHALKVSASSAIGPLPLRLDVEIGGTSKVVVFNLPGGALSGQSLTKVLPMNP